MASRKSVLGFVLVAAGAFAAGCGAEMGGKDPGTTLQDLVADPGTEDTSPVDPGPLDPGPTDPGPTDPGPTDPGPADPGKPDVPDTFDPGPADVPPVCPVLTCEPDCPHGQRTDLQGCPTCECRDCEKNNDCFGQIACPDPVCDGGGRCGCTCFGSDAVDYTCPDGTEVPWCTCSPLGRDCIDHPEYLCPALCNPGRDDRFPCADGTMKPWCTCQATTCEIECRPAGALGQGWYDTCTNQKVLADPCDGCGAACSKIGTLQEGWYSSCGDSQIVVRPCAPERKCETNPEQGCGDPRQCTPGQETTYACPDTQAIAFCRCEPPEAKCQPSCSGVGTPNEGWLNPCTGALQKAKCSGCKLTCEGIGSKSEGWVSDCGGPVMWAQCGTVQWTCGDKPWDACGGHPGWCISEGGNLYGSGQWATCCPGLHPIEGAMWTGDGCAYPAVAVQFCTLCGDGLCVPPESPCNCTEDCAGLAWPRRQGDLCGFGGDCAPGLSCVRAAEDDPLGICTVVCTPPKPGDATPCPDGFACAPLPGHEAPGFCLRPCEQPGDCTHPLTCDRMESFAGTKVCFPWR